MPVPFDDTKLMLDSFTEVIEPGPTCLPAYHVLDSLGRGILRVYLKARAHAGGNLGIGIFYMSTCSVAIMPSLRCAFRAQARSGILTSSH